LCFLFTNSASEKVSWLKANSSGGRTQIMAQCGGYSEIP
jgi:hypothetical protein